MVFDEANSQRSYMDIKKYKDHHFIIQLTYYQDQYGHNNYTQYQL